MLSGRLLRIFQAPSPYQKQALAVACWPAALELELISGLQSRLSPHTVSEPGIRDFEHSKYSGLSLQGVQLRHHVNAYHSWVKLLLAKIQRCHELAMNCSRSSGNALALLIASSGMDLLPI